MVCIRAVIFDLDNVLYDEKDYIYASFRIIAAFLSEKKCLPEEEIFAKLVYDFKKKGSMYSRLFNDLIDDLELDKNLLQNILRLYESFDAEIKLFPASENILLTLRKMGIKLALVTNGGVRIQRNKIRLLGIEQFFDVVVFARDMPEATEKPNPSAYSMAIRKMGVKAKETLCVGDNPYTDFWGAKRLGIYTMRLLWGEFKDVQLSEDYESEIVLNNLEEFFKVFEMINQSS
jgi:putative hydrolase of the HAD superfamily